MAKRKRKPKVYSYVRFSTGGQESGDSLRRQYDWVDSWLKANGYELSDVEKMNDKGLSGFHGVHLKKGALGQFIEKAKAGEIEDGSILLVEDITRLTRMEPEDSIEMLVFGLFKNGIQVRTRTTFYDRESMRYGKIYALIAEIQTAFFESKYKSDRLTAARESERDRARSGQVIYGNCPAWLEIVELEKGDRKTQTKRAFQVNEKAKVTINQIFDWKLEGKGIAEIEKQLNKTASWKRKNGWRQSYIKKILKNRSLLGEFAPHQMVRNEDGSRSRKPTGEVVENYFPQVVKPEKFAAVQKQFEGNVRKGGRNGRFSNVLRHLVKCPYCGGVMRFEDKGADQKTPYIFFCDNQRRGMGCKSGTVSATEVLELVIDNCISLAPERVLPNQSDSQKQATAIRKQIGFLNAEFDENNEAIERYVDLAGKAKSESMRERYDGQCNRLDKRQNEIKDELDNLEGELTRIEKNPTSFQKWKNSLAELKSELTKDSPETRMRLNLHLHELIDRIDVFFVGYEKECKKPLTSKELKQAQTQDDFWFVLDEVFNEYMPDLANTKRFRKFAKQVMSRRMSKEGRFIRIYFKTDKWVDVAPDTSLANSMKLVKKERKNGWKFVFPDLQKIWEQSE